MSTKTGTRKKRPNRAATFILLKPDGVKRQLLAELLVRLKINHLRVEALRTLTLTERDVAFLYGGHKQRPSYEPMKKWLLSGPCVALRVTGSSAVYRVRTLMGTGAWPYPARSFRGTYATTQWKNVMHASDSPETAEKELGRFF